jgi:protein dithiol oxidoreductase (disulfide-forming)
MRVVLRALLAALALTTFACSAEDSGAAKFQEGKQYKGVTIAARPVDPKRITVEEFFWYGCPHCFHLDPEITAWSAKKAPDIDFIRIPATLGRPEGVVHQKTFYSAEVLGIGEKMHKPLFDAIHVEHKPLFTQEAVRDWVGDQFGILPDVFDNTFKGFTVAGRVGKADALAKDYGLFSVPTIVVGGKYQTNAQMAGGFPQMIECINFLADKVRKERKN